MIHRSLTTLIAGILLCAAHGEAQTDLQGRVIDQNNNPVRGVIARLARSGLADTTGPDGVYRIYQPATLMPHRLPGERGAPVISQGGIHFTVTRTTDVTVSLFTMNGKRWSRESFPAVRSGRYSLFPLRSVAANSSAPGVLMIELRTGGERSYFKVNGLDCRGKGPAGLLRHDRDNSPTDAKNSIQLSGPACPDTIYYEKNAQLFSSSGLSSLLTSLPDLVISQRELFGGMITSDPYGIGSVQAVLSGTNLPETRYIDLAFIPASHYFNGYLVTVGTADTMRYTVYVQVFDSAGRPAGRSETITFTPTTGNIQVPEFDADNGKPVIGSVSADTTVGINDTVFLHSTAVDRFGGCIERYEWKIGENSWTVTHSGDTAIVAPPTARHLVCSLRVTDNDGHLAVAALLVTVETRQPVAVARGGGAVFINEPVTVRGSASSDETAIVAHAWKFGQENWVAVKGGDTTIPAPATQTSVLCSLRVMDDDGTVVYDTLRIVTSARSITDIDGNRYPVIIVGSRFWTTVNLRTSRFRDGSPIPLVTPNDLWAGLTAPARCFYGNVTDSAQQDKWGTLYNWYTVDSGTLAPEGWRVPDDGDWTILERQLIADGYNFDGTTVENRIAKSMAAQTDWTASGNAGAIGNDVNANNASGFSALPAGYRYLDGNFGFQGRFGCWWSASANQNADAWYRYLGFDIDFLYRHNREKTFGFSVRLVRG